MDWRSSRQYLRSRIITFFKHLKLKLEEDSKRRLKLYNFRIDFLCIWRDMRSRGPVDSDRSRWRACHRWGMSSPDRWASPLAHSCGRRSPPDTSTRTFALARRAAHTCRRFDTRRSRLSSICWPLGNRCRRGLADKRTGWSAPSRRTWASMSRRTRSPRLGLRTSSSCSACSSRSFSRKCLLFEANRTSGCCTGASSRYACSRTRWPCRCTSWAIGNLDEEQTRTISIVRRNQTSFIPHSWNALLWQVKQHFCRLFGLRHHSLGCTPVDCKWASHWTQFVIDAISGSACKHGDLHSCAFRVNNSIVRTRCCADYQTKWYATVRPTWESVNNKNKHVRLNKQND